MLDDILLLIISSPSGAGKTTLTRDLLEHFEDMTFSVSHTTRKPRPNEVDGKDYHFIDRNRFDALVTGEAFLEWAEVHDNRYGTSLAELQRARDAHKKSMVFDIDYQGARQIKAVRPDAVSVFVLPPSLDALAARLRSRASDDDATIERRFRNAHAEIAQYGFFDYLVLNDELEQAKLRMRSIVYAERSRRQRMARTAEKLLRQGRTPA